MVIEVTFDVTDVYISTTVSPVYVNVSFEAPAAGGAAVWGGITGTLSNQTDLQTALDLKVPYTGATTNVNLGEYEIKAGQVTLDTSPTGTAVVGTTRWNDTLGSSETTLKGGNVILKNGVDLVARVVNKVSPNTTLTKASYQAVRVSGAQGQRLAVAFAQANNDNNSADTIGLVIETIATNQEGFIMTVGQIEGINTTGSLQGETWADGDVLYLSPTTAGALTNVKPNATIGHIVVIGYVEYAHANNGKIYVKVMNGWELGELHDVYVPTPSNNDVLTYETSSGLWKNKSVATALGYTPANVATTLTINGVTYDLSSNRSWTVSGGISGSGASGQVAYWTGTSAQSGSNNLFWNNTNSRLGIGNNNPQAPLHVSATTAIGAIITGTQDNQVQITTTGTNNAALISLTSGNGTTSGRFAYFMMSSSETSPQRYDVGLRGNKNLVFFDQTANAARLTAYATTGNIGINTSSDTGEKFQVQGTTLLNGNVTFSSATGMFWDATNSRLGIGTNSPSGLLDIIGSLVTARLTTSGHLSLIGTNTTAAAQTILTLSTGVGNATGPNIILSKARGQSNEAITAADSLGTLQFQGANGAASVVSATIQSVAESLFTSSSRSSYLGFFTTGATTTLTEKVRIFGNGNTLIQNGGTFTDSGERLQVTGTMKVTGDITGGFTSVALYTASNGNLFTNKIENISNSNWIEVVGAATISTTNSSIYLGRRAGLSWNSTSGVRNVIETYNNINPTSGTAITNIFSITGIINQTGGANGITRGLYVNPTLTAAADFRAIETTNGKVIFGNLPTSSAGLPTGAIWNDAGTIKIV